MLFRAYANLTKYNTLTQNSCTCTCMTKSSENGEKYSTQQQREKKKKKSTINQLQEHAK